MVYTLVCHAYVKDDATAIEKFKRKLIEASRVYRHDRETIDWHVMQDVHDPRKFTIVERFEHESVRRSGCARGGLSPAPCWQFTQRGGARAG